MRAVLAALALLAGPVAALECQDSSYMGNRYTWCKVDAAREDLRLFLYNPDGGAWGQFPQLDASLGAEDKALLFAMNAGMYHPNRAPVGLYIEDGETLKEAVSSAGPGNFGLLPNGILCIRARRADVIETRKYLADRPACDFATQSGPMLVIDGELHPRFIPDSDSRYLRNGVGTSDNGKTAIFAISNNPVNFHDFASFFRDGLKLDQALFLDGNVSRLYAPGFGRRDLVGRAMGPIVGVVGTPD
ncbi:phosphodiester glycosidase family protein [Citreicella sp. C3M06]|uniref:phosphodiester glycosidase family protein n=1 Tax=Citreicella sp. C3M06 TaxID=2841564 RepID=UPI00352F491E